MNVTLKNAEIFGGLVLSGEGGSAIGGGPPAPLRIQPPSLLVCCFFVFAEMGATSTASGWLEINPFLSEKRTFSYRSEPLWCNSSFSCINDLEICLASRSLLPTISMEMKQDLKAPVLLTTLNIMLHAKLSISVIIFLICMLPSKKDMQGTV